MQEYINEKAEKILLFCRKPQQRKDVMEHIGLVNNVKNYDTYMAPLVHIDWIRMTILTNQQALTNNTAQLLKVQLLVN